MVFYSWRIKSEPDLNSVEYITTFGQMMTAFVLMYAFCDFGEQMTNQFETFDEQLYQRKWYLFPIEMQHMLVTFMSITQQPAIIHGFGNTEVSRDTFKKVFINI